MAENIWSKGSVLSYLQDEEAKLNSIMIRDLILDHKTEADRMSGLYLRYKGESLPIGNKKAKDSSAPNNKLAHDFRGEIVDQKVGFSFGQPVTYEVDADEDLGEEKAAALDKALQDFSRKNRLASLDLATAKYQSACGRGARLLYIDEDTKKFRVINIPPWECIFIRDAILDQVVYAIRYWEMEEVTEGAKRKYIQAEFYDSTHLYNFYESAEGVFVADENEPSKEHGFKKVPLIEFRNKEECKGDFEKVETLIDMYDKIQSFNGDELEAFRNAYLVFKNSNIDEEFIAQVKKTGGIDLPEGADVDWLIKNVNGDFVEAFLNRLENDIYRFSKTVNMNDEKFSGAGQSGESRKWKLKTLSDDAIIKEASFEEAVFEMFATLGSIGEAVGQDYADNISLQFTNNIPIDILYQAEATAKLKGNVSEQTRLSLLSFVDDVEAELQMMRDEREETMDFMNEQFNNQNNEGDDGNVNNQQQEPDDDE